MAVTGKTGADAVSRDLTHICRVITKYNAKIIAVVSAAEAAGVINAAQAAVANTFIGDANSFCLVWALIAGFSGF